MPLKDDNSGDMVKQCVHGKQRRARTCHCGNLDEHIYDTPLQLRPRAHSRRCQSLWLTVSILLGIAVVGLTVYDIVFVSVSQSQCPSASAQYNAVNNTFCVDCTSITQQISNWSESCLTLLAITTADGVSQCCAANAAQLSALLDLCANQQVGRPVQIQKTREHSMKMTPASAHKRLLPPPDKPDNSQGSFYKGFERLTLRLDPYNGDPFLEHARGVRVEEVGIVVEFPGLYYVYSSIHYKPSSRHAQENCQNETWLHYVFRISPNIPDNTGQLLETAYTANDSCLKVSGTAFTGGVFSLKSDDYIQVQASIPSMVEYGMTSTYLGLIMLGSEGE